jgi:hypothetical protein
MAKSVRKSARRKSKKLHRGGAGPWTGAYTVGPPLASGSYGQEIVPTSGCDAAMPGGFISSYTARGLPGIGGGRRSRRKRVKKSRSRKQMKKSRRKRKQRGGRYTFDLSAGAIGNGPFSAGAEVSRIPCEGGMVNTGPVAALANPAPMAGGAAPPLGAPYAKTDNAAYYAPTAGYENQPSGWVGAAGAPSLLQIPYDARSYNPACLKTN